MLLAALTAVTALSIDMSLPAMPQLQRSFDAGVSPVQLTLSLFLAGFAVGQLICGPLSDRVGRRPVLLAGLAAFTIASLACAASVSLPMLIGFRFLQGVAASVGPILARAIVRDRFESRDAASVLSQITQVMIIAPLLAPTLGGYLLVLFGWPAIFLVLGVSGTLLWVISWRHLPETARALDSAASDRRGSIWTGFGRVLSDRSSRRFVLAACFSYAGMFAYISGSPFIFIDGFHVARQHFGYLFALTAVALLAGATVNRILLARHTPTTLLRRGVFVLFVAGMLLGLTVSLGIGGIAGVVLPMMVYMFGLGLVQPNAIAAAMAPHERLAGVSASVIGSLQTVGGALAGYCVSAFYDHTPASLAVMVSALATCTLLAVVMEPVLDPELRTAAA